MKKTIYFLFALSTSISIQAQEYVHQVLVLNEGYFDYTNNQIIEPASIGSYDPASDVYSNVLELEGMRFGSDMIIVMRLKLSTCEYGQLNVFLSYACFP